MEGQKKILRGRQFLEVQINKFKRYKYEPNLKFREGGGLKLKKKEKWGNE